MDKEKKNKSINYNNIILLSFVFFFETKSSLEMIYLLFYGDKLNIILNDRPHLTLVIKEGRVNSPP